MKTSIAKKLKKEIEKIQDPVQKEYLELIYKLEATQGIDLENDPLLCAIIPEKLGMDMEKNTGKKVEASVWYQQYRTMKALLQKPKKDMAEAFLEELEGRSGKKIPKQLRGLVKKQVIENLKGAEQEIRGQQTMDK